jgi:hypothetical protein
MRSGLIEDGMDRSLGKGSQSTLRELELPTIGYESGGEGHSASALTYTG